MIRIFDIKDGVVVPTEHCTALSTLKRIMDEYENYMQVYLYLFYMSCPDPMFNPFFNVPELDKEEVIILQLGDLEFSPEDDAVIEALKFLRTLYETPTARAYRTIQGALDKISIYMDNVTITDGRDGNLTAIVNTAVKFDKVRESFKGIYKDLIEEQKNKVRGDSHISYDQRMDFEK